LHSPAPSDGAHARNSLHAIRIRPAGVPPPHRPRPAWAGCPHPASAPSSSSSSSSSKERSHAEQPSEQRRRGRGLRLGRSKLVARSSRLLPPSPSARARPPQLRPAVHHASRSQGPPWERLPEGPPSIHPPENEAGAWERAKRRSHTEQPSQQRRRAAKRRKPRKGERRALSPRSGRRNKAHGAAASRTRNRGNHRPSSPQPAKRAAEPHQWPLTPRRQDAKLGSHESPRNARKQRRARTLRQPLDCGDSSPLFFSPLPPQFAAALNSLGHSTASHHRDTDDAWPLAARGFLLPSPSGRGRPLQAGG
jgi:hypothetical protein